MDKAYFCTIWHTGTHYFKAGLEQHYRVSFTHFNHATLRQAKNYEHVFTTFRDPKRVAASWANRGRLKTAQGDREWKAQWNEWSELLKRNPIILDVSKGREQYGIKFPKRPMNHVDDKLGLHKAIDENNMDYFYTEIPRELIELAEDLSHGMRKTTQTRQGQET